MWVCVCLERRQSPFCFVNIIIIIFHVRSILPIVYFAASQSACATKSLFYLPFYDKPDICLVCSHPLVCNFNSARTLCSWRTLHSIVFGCEFVNYLTENSFQFSAPYSVDAWSWARHRTDHTKHIPCTTVHFVIIDHLLAPNNCRIIVVVSTTMWLSRFFSVVGLQIYQRIFIHDSRPRRHNLTALEHLHAIRAIFWRFTNEMPTQLPDIWNANN